MKENLLNKIKHLNPELLKSIETETIHLELESSQQDDAFYVEVLDNDITIKASKEENLFYGLLTVLEAIQKGVDLKTGWHTSRVKERGLNVDLGRKHYTLSWFKSLIEQMALNKLNVLQMHFSENLGYRLESSVYSDITSIEHLTHDDLKEIIKHGQTYYIEVIPALDAPGHLEHVLSFYPEHQMENLTTGLDITRKESRDFIKKLYDEVIELFAHTDKIHIGADEFINFDEYDLYPSLENYAKTHISKDATAADTYVDFINDISNHLISKGKDVRVWNDGLYRKNIHNTVELNKDITVCYWTSWNENMAEVSTFIEKGHQLINFDDQNLYYVLGEAAGYTYPTAKKIKENFDVFKFPMREEAKLKQANEFISQNNEKVLGAYFSVWSDLPEKLNETEILTDLTNLLIPFGDNFWK